MIDAELLSSELKQGLVERDAVIVSVENYLKSSIAPYQNATDAGLAPNFDLIANIYATIGSQAALAHLIIGHQESSYALNGGMVNRKETPSAFYSSAANHYHVAADELQVAAKQFSINDLPANKVIVDRIAVVIAATRECARKCLLRV